MECNRIRTDITGLLSQGSTIELMTQKVLEHIGLEPINLFHAMEALYHCANAPYKNIRIVKLLISLSDLCLLDTDGIRTRKNTPCKGGAIPFCHRPICVLI